MKKIFRSSHIPRDRECRCQNCCAENTKSVYSRTRFTRILQARGEIIATIKKSVIICVRRWTFLEYFRGSEQPHLTRETCDLVLGGFSKLVEDGLYMPTTFRKVARLIGVHSRVRASTSRLAGTRHTCMRLVCSRVACFLHKRLALAHTD